MEYDDIIVGAGSSGAVLAARLSEQEQRSVLLLEAGPDYLTPESTPAALLDCLQVPVPDHDWGYTATLAPGRHVDYPRGRVTGGSSAVNGAFALRGVPADYDAWAAQGNPAWTWDKVLPYFRRLEDDQDFGGDLHGRGGPLPIVRARPEDLTPPQRGFVAACRALGFPEAPDMNDPEASGVSPLPRNIQGGVRVSTATAYLLSARGRLNLTVRGGCLVDRVLFEAKRAVGVAVESGGRMQRVYGRRVTLAAGAIATPAILLRSGIGPRDVLSALGIAPVVVLPGVGGALREHPQIGVNCMAKAGSILPGGPMAQVALRYTAHGSAEWNDMQLYIMHFPESMTIRLAAVLQRPRATGRVTIASADPHVQPVIDFNLCADPEDVRRLAEGVRLIWAIAQHPAVAEHLEGTATLDDGTVLPLSEAAGALGNGEAAADYVRRAANHFFHAAGTARMGGADDPGAVVDEECRVHGVEGLRVVDASVMPGMVRANTNLTCIMIAERLADWLHNA